MIEQKMAIPPGAAHTASQASFPAVAPRTRSIAVWGGLALVVLLGLALRLVWWQFGPKVIESEGINYARVGENIAAGQGLIGLGGPDMGLQLLYPPLYELLIAAGVKLGLGAETAGRGVSLLSGALLPVVAWLFARRCCGTVAGWFAALIAAIHPLLIVVSTAVLTESTYLTLTLTAAYFALDVLFVGSRRAAMLAGVFLGLAYLLRPEAFVLTFVLVLAVPVANHRRWRPAVLRAGLLVAVFAVFASPYIAFLWQQTGQLRFEAKTADAIRYARELESGLNIGAAYFGIDENLVEVGNSNTSDVYQLQNTNASIAERTRFLVKQAAQNLPRLLRGIGDPQLGAPFIEVLAALGLFAVPWGRARLRLELPLLILTALTVLTFCSWPFFHDRFLYPVLPALVVWGGAGLARLANWASSTALQLGFSAIWRRSVVTCAIALPLGLVCASAAVGVRSADELSQSWTVPSLRDDLPVARWLSTQAHGARVMDTGPTVAFYSGDIRVPFPWTDGATTLRYIEHKQIAFLILRDTDRDKRPYMAEWLQTLPTDRLELIQTFQGESGATYVYRWRSETTSDRPGDASPA